MTAQRLLFIPDSSRQCNRWWSALCVVLEILGLNARYQIQSGSQSVNEHKRVLNVVAGATDASRAMLLTPCSKVELLTAIFGFL